MTRHVPSRPVGSAQFFAVGRLAVLAVLACAATPLTARAQFGLFGSGFVFDPSNFARNVLHYARRLEQMNLQRQQLGLELAAMRKLPSPSWREIGSTAGQVDALMAGGQALGYSLRAIDREFARTFPGTRVFQNYPAEQASQAVRTLATLRATLNALNRATRDVPTSVAQLDRIKRQLATAQGHEAALELNGTIGMYTAEELTLLRQAVTALTNVQTVYYADQVNGAAQETATLRARLTALSAPGRTYPPYTLHVTP
jgi:P-type conjugative transfer protein TrbJ